MLGDVLVFVYTNSCQITEQNVADLLNIGDMFLLPGIINRNFMNKEFAAVKESC